MTAKRAVIVAYAALSLAMGVPSLAAAEDWHLNPLASRLHMQTIKANSVIETHRFTGLEGTVSADGRAKVKIELTSVVSGVDVRDVRMRFLLFETYKFPHAEVSARLDLGALREVMDKGRVNLPLKLSLSLHGMAQDLEAEVNVTRIRHNAVSVTTAQPIIINAEMFGLAAGVTKLSEAVGGIPIVPAASFIFDLVFESGDTTVSEIRAVQLASASRRQVEETRQITAEECETRFSVISTAGAIYFKTGSTELDRTSEPLLNSVADIANRCPGMKIEVTGHTDSVGQRDSNRQLSELRARSVVQYLGQQGVPQTRIDAQGFGDSRPIVPNDSETNRAKNRRIEFRVVRGRER